MKIFLWAGAPLLMMRMFSLHAFQSVRALSLTRYAVRADTGNFGNPVMWVVDSTDPPADAGPMRAPPLRVLFVGNSLTYVNDVPAQFRSIAAAGMHRRIVTQMLTRPGETLAGLWEAGHGVVAHVLHTQPWDIVILQGRPEQSAQSGGLVLNIAQVIAGFDTLQLDTTVRALVADIRAQHAQALLFVPAQGDEGDPRIDLTGPAIDSIHTRLGRTLGIPVAHGSDIMARIKKTHRSLRAALFEPGGGHQSALGAYLQALVLYTTVTQQSPVGLPHPVLPGLTDSVATLFQTVVASRAALSTPDASATTVPLSRALPIQPQVVVELFTDLACAVCGPAMTAVAASGHAASSALIVPLVWPIGVANVLTPTGAQARLTTYLATSHSSTAASSAAAGTLPTIAVDGVPTPLVSLPQALAAAAQRPHIWVTAYLLNGTQFGARFDGVPTAAPRDSLDVWGMITERRNDSRGAPLAVVRVVQLLQTVSVRDGLYQIFLAPTVPTDVRPAQTTLVLVVQAHGGGDIVGAVSVPLMVYAGAQP